MPLLVTLLVVPLHAAADTLSVTDPDSLRAALDVASDGDTIQLAEGSYGAFALPALDLTLLGGVGVEASDISVPPGASLHLEQVVITGGSKGLLVSGGAAVVERVTFTGLSGEPNSYAIRTDDAGSVTLRDVIIEDCQSPLGAVQVASGALALEGVTLSTISGPALWVSGGSVTGSSVLFSDNQAVQGAALLQAGGTVQLSDALFLDNQASSKGGAVYLAGGDLVVADSEWSGGAAALGGHLYLAGGTASLTRTHLLDGHASFGGGGVAVQDGTLTVRNALWQHLSGDRGGALLVGGGAVSIAHAVFSGNDGSVGAAAAVDAGTLSIDSSILVDHRGAEAIANATATAVRLTRSLLHDNPLGDWLGSLYISELVEDAGPRFVNAADGDFALGTGSPALDVGDTADLDGTAADMGLHGGPDAWPLSDDDADGYVYGRDCDDRNPTMNESVQDIWYDGLDSDCGGNDDYDQDGDGFPAAAFGGEDCDDTDASIHPGAEEALDGRDSDCDEFDLSDADGDGWPSDLDCDDRNPSSHPGAEESWYDGTDSDCSGGSDFDQDGDGHTIASVGGDDCDDTDPFVSPSAPEIRDDGIDQDCDGLDAVTAQSEDTSAEVPGHDITPEAPDEAADAAVAAAPESYQPGQFTATCSAVSPRAGLLGVLAVALVSLSRRRRR